MFKYFRDDAPAYIVITIVVILGIIISVGITSLGYVFFAKPRAEACIAHNMKPISVGRGWNNLCEDNNGIIHRVPNG